MYYSLFKNEIFEVWQDEFFNNVTDRGYVIGVNFDAFYQVFTNKHAGLFKDLGFEFHFSYMNSDYDYIIRTMRCKVTNMQEKKDLIEKVKELVISLSKMEKLQDREYIYKNNWQFNEYASYFHFFKENYRKIYG